LIGVSVGDVRRDCKVLLILFDFIFCCGGDAHGDVGCNGGGEYDDKAPVVGMVEFLIQMSSKLHH
jgi:hypothetical protein